MKRIKDFLRAALFLAAVCFFSALFFIVFIWTFGPYLASCFDFTENWTVEEKAQLGEAIENPQ